MGRASKMGRLCPIETISIPSLSQIINSIIEKPGTAGGQRLFPKGGKDVSASWTGHRIFDLENTTISKLTKEFLTQAEKQGRVRNVSYELPKSFVICAWKGKQTVYITQISSATLKKRAGFIDGIANISR